VEVDRSWWVSWTSNPVGGVKSVPGGFDSHAPPPLIFKEFLVHTLFLLFSLTCLKWPIVPMKFITIA